MARKRSSGKTTDQGLTISQAAKKVGVSQAGVRKWIKEEPRLARCVSKKTGVARLGTRGVKVLGEIKKERFKKVNKGLRSAWNARSATSSKKRTAATKKRATRKTKAKVTRKTGAKGRAVRGNGLSGAEAAKKLGVNKNLVYDLLKQFSIAKKDGPKQFTEGVMKQLRDALKKRRGKKSSRASRSRKAAVSTKKRKAAPRAAASSVTTVKDGVGSAMKTIEAAVDATIREYHEKLDELRRFFEDQKDVIERGMKAVGLRDK